MKDLPELIFVYNANSGKWNAYMDTMHKIVSPKTYPCSLCAITYGYLGIKEDWADFKKRMPLKMKFLHKDEWEKSFSIEAPLPAVFLKNGENLEIFLEAEQLNNFDLEHLKSFIVKSMKGLNLEMKEKD